MADFVQNCEWSFVRFPSRTEKNFGRFDNKKYINDAIDIDEHFKACDLSGIIISKVDA